MIENHEKNDRNLKISQIHIKKKIEYKIVLSILAIFAILMVSVNTVSAADTTPPASITGLKNVSYAQDYINWTWKDPSNSDFAKVMIYINGKFKTNVTKGKRYYNLTGRSPSTTYKISTHTVDSSGNINKTWVNGSAKTAPDTIPPKSITNLKNITYAQNYIKWTWSDPSDSDFSKVMIYINGKFKTNVSKGTKSYNATGLIPDTSYDIGTHTVDTRGNINKTWVNHTAITDPVSDIAYTQIVTNLHNISYAQNYINWTWTDPTDPNYSKINVYIDGKYTKNVSIGVGYYNATGFLPNTSHEISTKTIDIYDNINPIWVNDTKRTAPLPDAPLPDTTLPNTIRFITIGDTHITSSTSTSQYQRLTRAVDYINSRTDVDFVVQLGDVTDNSSEPNFVVAQPILDRLNKPYYVVEGNHDDGVAGANFIKYFGPTEHIENINGYQLIFAGVKEINGLHWSFNYSTANKSKPTIIFNHGPVQPDIGISTCESSWGDSLHRYACSMRSETDKFTNLLGFYDGHVHVGTNQTIGNTLYVTQDNLGGRTTASDYIGYTVIQNGVVDYKLLYYK